MAPSSTKMKPPLGGLHEIVNQQRTTEVAPAVTDAHPADADADASTEEEGQQQQQQRLKLTKCLHHHHHHQLYGREEEQQRLHSLVETIQRQDATTTTTTTTTGPQICLVHGVSGSGKTSLCECINNNNSNNTKSNNNRHGRKPFFASGKFDQYQDFSDPYSALVTAFDTLGNEILKTNDRILIERYQQALVGGTNNILTKLIPSFAKLVSLLEQQQRQERYNNNDPNHQNHQNDNNRVVEKELSSSLSLPDHLPLPTASATTTDPLPPVVVKRRSSSNSSSHHNNYHQALDNHLELVSERLAMALCTFIDNVCTSDHPLILFVDDIQWIDVNSRDVLSAILETIETNHFLFLGCYRDEEQEDIDPFLEKLHQMTKNKKDGEEDCTTTSITDIQLTNLTVHQVDQFVSNMLGSSTSCSSHNNNDGDDTDGGGGDALQLNTTSVVTSSSPQQQQQQTTLSQLIHQQTAGNPYFVLQYLRILQQHNLLTYDLGSNTWQWDIELIKRPSRGMMMTTSTSSSSSQEEQQLGVNYFVTERIRHESPDVLRILKLAACLGFAVDVKLMEHLDYQEFFLSSSASSSSSVPSSPSMVVQQQQQHRSMYYSALKKAEAEELVYLADGTCKFTHDRVQQCVYELIPIGPVRDALHFKTGKLIMEYASLETTTKKDPRPTTNIDTKLLFLATDQCNRGSSSIENEKERLNLIRLNLCASQAAGNKSGAVLVADFLNKAIELIRDRDWETSYDLVLQIYSASSEVESARGKFDRSDKRVERILERAQKPQDKVRALAVRARSLGAKQEYTAAILEIRSALSLLGVKIPKSSYKRVMVDLIRTRNMLKNKTEDDLLNLKPMTDQRMVTAMKILQFGMTWGWNADIYFGSQSILAMIHLTLEHGCCYLSPFAFAGFGNLLANFLKKEKEACWFAQLAGRFEPDKASIPATTMILHSYLSHLRLPVSASLEPTLLAYRVSLETGDLAMGAICLGVYHWIYKFCGLPLGPLAADLRKYLNELRLCQQEFLLAFDLPDLHLALNLTGQTDDPRTISWENIHQSDLFTYKTVISSEHPAELNRLYTQMFNSLILGDLAKMEESLSEVLSRSGVYRRFDGSHVSNQFFIFFDGLASFALLRKYRRRKDVKVANEARKQLRKMSKRGSINCVGLLQFLNAEHLASRVPPRWENRRKASSRLEAWLGTVKRAYDVAAAQLSRSGFLHYSALAKERIGEFMLLHGDQYWATHYLSDAMTLYHDWGASVKVQLLLDTHAFLQPDTAEESVTSWKSDRSLTRRVSVRARPRFNSTVDSVAELISERELRVDRSERTLETMV